MLTTTAARGAKHSITNTIRRSYKDFIDGDEAPGLERERKAIIMLRCASLKSLLL